MEKFIIMTVSVAIVLGNLFTPSITAALVIFDKLYIFGDSLSDIGNDFHLTDGAVPPTSRYYQGRFSNGRVWIEYLADEFKLTINPSEPGFAVTAEDSISFAYGGAGTGISNLTPGQFPVPGTLGQVKRYKKALKNVNQPADPNALYIVWGGANDYLLSMPPPNTISGIPFPPDPIKTVNNITTAIRGLYVIGARNFLVPNLPDLGETPIGIASGAAAELTALTKAHNQLLKLAFLDLIESLEDINLFFLDVYELFKKVVDNPNDFGFSNGVAAGPAAGCLLPPFNCHPVDFTTDTIFWDEQHPSTAMHQLIGQAAFETLAAPKLAAVVIDIKPGGFPNSINPRSKGLIPVAILTTAGDPLVFDALQVDPQSVTFGPDRARSVHLQGRIKDVDGDGNPDMVLHFKTQETGISCGDTSGILTGKTFAGQMIIGLDTIKTVGCKMIFTYFKRASISSTCSSGLTFGNTAAICPDSSIR